MSVFRYNNITLPYCFITNFLQEALGDDVSNTDYCTTKFDITIQAVINSNYLSLVAPDLVVDGSPITHNPADVMSVIRSRLLQRRRRLSVKFNNVELMPEITATETLEAPSTSGAVDVRNGPTPISCTITQLTDTTFLVVYHIIAYYWESNYINTSDPSKPIAHNQIANDVLFNRWTETVDIDNLGFTRRVRNGKFMIRSDNADGLIADQLRPEMAIVGVPPGFLRESSSYTVTPDGLAIQYRVTDKEQFKMPPSPAFQATGRYTETTSKGGGIRFGECRVLLRGSKTTPQDVLLGRAIEVCASKIAINNGGPGVQLHLGGQTTRSVLEHGAVHVDMYNNEVEVVLKYMLRPLDLNQMRENKNGLAGIRWKLMTKTPISDEGGNEQYTPDYRDRGTAGLLIRAAAYFDPSISSTEVDRVHGNLKNRPEVGTLGKNPEP